MRTLKKTDHTEVRDLKARYLRRRRLTHWKGYLHQLRRLGLVLLAGAFLYFAVSCGVPAVKSAIGGMLSAIQADLSAGE